LPRAVETRGAACVELTPEPFRVITRRHHDVVAGLETALDPQPSNERRRIERCAPPASEDPSRVSKPVTGGNIPERWARLWQ
jgi:hypothetical protein